MAAEAVALAVAMAKKAVVVAVTALLLSAMLMLHHIDETAAAEAIMKALGAVLSAGVRTRDLSGNATTREFADAVCKML